MPELKRQSPYQGLVPYEEEDASWFFGREKETRLIIANLFASPLTLLYGASGVGKSSVLGAGVVHQLRQRADLLVVLFKSWQGDPAAELEATIADAALRAPAQKMPSTPPSSLADCLTACITRVGGLGRRLMIILDQFEEYFLYHPQDDAFAEQFPALLTQTDLPLSFLVSIREDSWAKLDRFEARIPILFDNYLRIDYLDREAARSAIETPIGRYSELQEENQQPFKIEPELVEAVLDQVKTGRVVLAEMGRGAVRQGAGPTSEEARIETPYLQLVMTRLWDEELKEKSHVLRLTTLNEKLGGAKRIVRTHLDETLNKLSDGEQQIVARMFHYLVTPSGTKIAQTLPDLAEYAGVPGAQIEPLLEKLGRQESRLVRAVPPPPGQPAVARYEIFHDVLAPAILDWRARYVQAQELTEARKKEEEANRRAEEQARFAETERELALNAKALAEAERQRAEEQTRLAEIQQSLARKAELLAEERARQTKRFRLFAMALGGMLLLALVAVGFALWQRAVARARELVSGSVLSEETDPEIAVLIAAQAVRATWPWGHKVLPEAEQQLHRAILASHVRLTMSGHHGPVSSVSWSPDGKWLATASVDTTAKVWDAETGKELLTLNGHSNYVMSVAWSPDGKRLATGSADNTAKVWDVATGKELLTLSGHTWSVTSVAWSPDGKRLATGSWDKTAKVWDAATGKELLTLSGHSNFVASVAWSPDGNRLATASDDKTAKVWDAGTGKEFLTLSGHSGEVSSLAWSPDGKRLATASWDNTAKVWEAGTGKELLILSGHSGWVTSVAWSSDGKRLATGCRDGTAKVWDAGGGKELLTLSGHSGLVTSVAWSPDGKRLGTTSADHTAKVWDAETGKELLTLRGHGDVVSSAAWSPDGKRLATGSWDKTAKVWDAETGKELLSLRGHNSYVSSVAWSPDGKRLATGSYDNTAKLWDAETGKELLTLSGHRDSVNSVAWSPDGKRLATGSDDNTAKVWDPGSGNELLTLSGHSGYVRSVAWSPDGKRLATGSSDKTAKVWDAETDKELLTLSSHGNYVSSVAWSPDGKRLATGSFDKTAKVWEAGGGKNLLTLSSHSNYVSSVAWSPDGKRLASASQDATVQVYAMALTDLLALARQRVTAHASEEGCKKYLHVDKCPPVPELPWW